LGTTPVSGQNQPANSFPLLVNEIDALFNSESEDSFQELTALIFQRKPQVVGMFQDYMVRTMQSLNQLYHGLLLICTMLGRAQSQL